MAYDDKIITLYKCRANQLWNDKFGFRKSSYKVDYIILGKHIKNPVDLKFKKITVRYSNFDRWISNSLDGLWCQSIRKETSTIKYTKPNPIKVQIRDDYVIQIVLKSQIQSSTDRKEASIKEIKCIEIESLKNKSLEGYQKIKTWIQNFLALALSDIVLTLSIEGDLESNNFDSICSVKIYYESPYNQTAIKKKKLDSPILFDYETISNRFHAILLCQNTILNSLL